MKERGIIMSAPMVRALLDESKTQTRRVFKLPRRFEEMNLDDHYSLETTSRDHHELTEWETDSARSHLIECPYGVAGDRLWVRETHWRFGKWVRNGKTKTGRQRWRFKADESLKEVHYATEDMSRAATPARDILGWHKRPSIFMPKWAARLWFEITRVRVERLQDISNAAAIAEGMHEPGSGPGSAKSAYRILWDSLHGKGAWELNPWVWVLEFRNLRT